MTDTDLLFKALADPSRRRLLDLLHAQVPLQKIYERWIRKFERSRPASLGDLKRQLVDSDDENP